MLTFVRLGDKQLDEAKGRLIEHLRSEVPDQTVIQAMERVPRELFVPEESRHLAYVDIPVPIGEGQTISQPFIVALMIRALELKRTDRVLEIGSGSGYQAAVISELVDHVIGIERIQSLADSARKRLACLHYNNVEIQYAEERLGWERRAPYDAIIVAAGAPTLPRQLMEQMSVGGRLVIPVGSLTSQELMKVTRIEKAYSVKTLGACRFVPLLGEGAWPEEE